MKFLQASTDLPELCQLFTSTSCVTSGKILSEICGVESDTIDSLRIMILVDKAKCKFTQASRVLSSMSEVVCEPDMTAIGKVISAFYSQTLAELWLYVVSAALGNPIRSRVLREARHDEQDGILMRNFLLEGCIPGSDDEELRPDSGTTFFINKVDHERYEVGDFVIVRYSWNDKKDECIENAVLREQTCLDIKTFQNEVSKSQA